MKNRICSRCRTLIPADAPQGTCPKCLMALSVDPPEHFITGPDEPVAPPPKPEEIQPLFPQLEILRLIGRGGMGAVYEARQKGLNRRVALKILWVRAEADAGFEERFAREGRALAQLSHENVVAIHDAGKSGPFYWLLMEYVDGPNLRQVLAEGPLESARALPLVMQMCAALEYAHQEGVVHRDIKPENVLVTRSGRVKIADFGLAKMLARDFVNPTLTRSLQAMGTPHYMAPEQIEHPKDVDHRADIYSLGVVLYEVLTGELPLGRFQMPSRKVDADPRLDEIIGKAMQKEPDRRYQSASDVGTAVDGVVSGRSAVRPRESRRAAKPKRSWPVFAGIAATIALLGFFVVRSGVLRAKEPGRAMTAKELFEQARLDARVPKTMPEALARLRDAHQLEPGLENLQTFMEDVWREQVDTLLVAGEAAQAAGLAQELAGFAPSKSNTELSQKAAAAAKAELARYVRLESPGPLVGESSVPLVGQFTSPALDGAKVYLDGEEVPILNSKFRKQLAGLAEGDNTFKLSISHPDGHRLSFPLSFVVDTKKPVLTIEQPKEGDFVGGSVTVRGKVEDSTATKVVVCGVDVPVNANHQWSVEVPMKEGQQQIEVTATDARQQSERDTRRVTVDTVPPTFDGIGTSARFVLGSKRPSVQIRVVDDKALGSATLDGAPVSFASPGVIALEGKHRDTSSPTSVRTLKVLDKAGNSATCEVTICWDDTPPDVTFANAGIDSVLPNSQHPLRGTLKDSTACTLKIGNQAPTAIPNGEFDSSVRIEEATPGERITRRYVVRDEADNELPGTFIFTVVAPCTECIPIDGQRGLCKICKGIGSLEKKCKPNCQDGNVSNPCPQCNSQGMARCEFCQGTGKGAPVNCKTCAGTGLVQCKGKCGGNGTYIDTCGSCNGSGYTDGFGIRQRCGFCNQTGRAKTQCATCTGSGKSKCSSCANGKSQPTCPRCDGGWTTTVCANCNGSHTLVSTCPNCNGASKVQKGCGICEGNQYCKSCNGTGRADKQGKQVPRPLLKAESQTLQKPETGSMQGLRVGAEPAGPAHDGRPTPAAVKGTTPPQRAISWGDVLEANPDVTVVTDAAVRKLISNSGLPWRVRDRLSGVEMLLVPPGQYSRGASPGDSAAAAFEGPRHLVVITKPFYLGRFEVQRSEWDHVMSGRSSKPDVKGLPLQGPTVSQVRQFLSRCDGIRLPTEGEWEFACRAGVGDVRYGPVDQIAWCPSNSNGTAHEVGGKLANAWGFCDMLGNVWEMCSDNYSDDEYTRCGDRVRDPQGPSTGVAWVIRGGSYNPRYNDDQCRASGRGGQGFEDRGYSTRGFRVARDP